jgi:hypothetical protein
MDLDTTEKTISIIVGVITLGGVLYAVFRHKVNRFVRRQFTGRRWHKHAKKCPRCGAPPLARSCLVWPVSFPVRQAQEATWETWLSAVDSALSFAYLHRRYGRLR